MSVLAADAPSSPIPGSSSDVSKLSWNQDDFEAQASALNRQGTAVLALDGIKDASKTFTVGVLRSDGMFVKNVSLMVNGVEQAKAAVPQVMPSSNNPTTTGVMGSNQVATMTHRMATAGTGVPARSRGIVGAGQLHMRAPVNMEGKATPRPEWFDS